MKNLCRASVFITLYLLLSACGGTLQSVPTSVSSPDVALVATSAATTDLSIEYWIQTSLANTPTATATFKPTAAATLRLTPTQDYVPPTLIPTVEPALVLGLVSHALSIQTFEDMTGQKMQQITGWDYGFGGGYWMDSCNGYYWLDASHLLLYPSAGEAYIDGYGGVSTKVNMVPQPVVINLENSNIWLPPINTSSSRECRRVYWSQELGILITSEIRDDILTVSTFTKDGHRLSNYPGRLLDVSPRGTKVLISNDILLDLKTNKTIKLTWSMEDYYEPILSDLYWTYPDEKRVYRCCYFYADLNTGISHRFIRSDFQDTNGTHLDPVGLWFHQGEWVQDNKYFLVSWLAVDDGPVRYLPMFDPATKLFYDVMEIAGIPDDWEAAQTIASPDGNYVWLKGWDDSYLVNLTTFEAQYYAYPDLSYINIWSPDSKFTWFQSHDLDNESTEFQILSISDKKLSPLPVAPLPDSEHWWHPSKAAFVYSAVDTDALIFLDAATMSYQELPFVLQDPPYFYGNVVWSPNGEKLALVSEDGSLWQVDYPKLGNLEQLTTSLPEVREVNWSPDGNSIAFVSGSDIYVVETNK